MRSLSRMNSRAPPPKERRKIGIDVVMIDALTFLQESDDYVSYRGSDDFVKHLESVERRSRKKNVFRRPHADETDYSECECVQPLANDCGTYGSSPKMAALGPDFHLGKDERICEFSNQVCDE